MIGQLSVCPVCNVGQTVGWIKMKLGMEIGLNPGHIVLDVDPAPPKHGTFLPIFGSCLLWPNGCPSQLLLSTCRDFLPSRSIGLVLKKLNLTQQQQTWKQSGQKHRKSKAKSKANIDQQPALMTVHMCVHIVVHNCHTQRSKDQF